MKPIQLLKYLFFFCIISSCKKIDPTPAPAPPAVLLGITIFTPASGPVGTVVIITGSGFNTTAGLNAVFFNNTAATVTAATSTQLTVTVPAGSATGKITMKANGNTVVSVTDFTVTSTPPSGGFNITGFSPGSATVGSTVVINGTGFNPTSTLDTVYFNGSAAIVTDATANQITAIISYAATTGKIIVKIGSVAVSTTTDFIILPAQNGGGTVLTGYSRVQLNYNTTDSFDFIYSSPNVLSKISDKNISGSGTYVSSSNFIKDASGKIIKKIHFYNGVADDDSTIYQYDGSGKLIKEERYFGNTVVERETIQYFTDRFEVIDVVNPSNAAVAQYKYTYYYTADGKNIARKEFINGIGKLGNISTYSYDNKKGVTALTGSNFYGFHYDAPLSFEFICQNNVLDETVQEFDASGNVSRTNFHHNTYTYNSSGYPITFAITFGGPVVINGNFQYQ